MGWDELDQRIIDKAIKQWRTRLRAGVEAKGGYFEQKTGSEYSST